jgi:hypothetical protein
VGLNAEKLLMLWATTRKNTHELKLEQFSALLSTTQKNEATMWKIFPHCGQQLRKMFSVVGKKAEESPQYRRV